MTRIEVNLNAVAADGTIRVRPDRPLRTGQVVRVTDTAGDVEGVATVARTNRRTGLAYLAIEWDGLRDLSPEAAR